MKSKYSYEFVYNYFKEHDCLLLSETYINANTKVEYQCPCGNISEIKFKDFLYAKGQTRCSTCAYKKSLNTKIKNGTLITGEIKRKKTLLERYGVDSPLKNNDIKHKREQTNLSRYGVKNISQSPAIREKQKKGLKDKYGFEYTMQIPSVKEKYKQTLLNKHGVPSLAYLSCCCSKESQKLFWEIHNKLSKVVKDKSHFAELNAEFVIGPVPEYFKYDFVNSILHKCIEYNGYNFHPRPDQQDDEINWKAFHPNTTVKEAREYENKKLKAIENRGYTVLVVWDYEFHKDFNSLVNKCMNFLMPENP